METESITRPHVPLVDDPMVMTFETWEAVNEYVTGIQVDPELGDAYV